MIEIPKLGEYSPVQISAILLLIISVVEFGIMGLMLLLQRGGLNLRPLLEAFMDSILLALLTIPAIYLLLIRPLRMSLKEMEKTKADLERSEKKFRRIVERSYDAIATLDSSGCIKYASPSMETVLGYKREEMKGSHFRKFISEEDVERAEEAFREAMDGETVEGIELGLRRKRDGELEVVGNASPIEEGEGAVQVIFRDSTELKERDRQLKVLDRFLRHNLHNDMNLILGHTENILEKTGVEEAEEIKETASHLIDTTDKEKEIVDIISKEGNPEILDLKEMVKRAVEKVESNYPGTKVQVSLPEEKDSLKIEALPDLERALYELLENAVIHAKTQEPKVEVSIESNDEIKISVKDQGERIPESEVQILKRKKEITPTQHGSGLGLLLIRWIVRRSNGKLEFQENEPSGNIITICLQRPDEKVQG